MKRIFNTSYFKKYIFCISNAEISVLLSITSCTKTVCLALSVFNFILACRRIVDIKSKSHFELGFYVTSLENVFENIKISFYSTFCVLVSVLIESFIKNKYEQKIIFLISFIIFLVALLFIFKNKLDSAKKLKEQPLLSNP